MVDSSETFDPYDDWLGIPREDQPPNHYRLLDLREFESSTAAIDEAAKLRAAYLHQLAGGPNREAVQKLLNEVARARRTLMDDRARREYDEQLRNPVDIAAAAPAFEIETGATPRAGKAPPSRRPRGRRPKRKSWINDWRVHGASISILLLAAITAVVYTHMRDTTKQAVRPMALQTSGRSYSPAPSRDQRALIAPDRRSAMEALSESPPASTPKRRSRRNSGGGFSGKSELALPSTDIELRGAIAPVIALPDNWLDGLDSVIDFSRPIAESFEIRRGGAVSTVRDGRLFLIGKKGNVTSSQLVATQWRLLADHAVALDTNIRPSNISSFAGMIVGPLRVRLTSQRNKLQLQVFDQVLATFTPPQGTFTTLAVLRDPVEQASFRWVLRAGDVNKSGRIEYTGQVGESIQVGVMLGSPKSNVKPAVWIDNFRIGKLSQTPPFSDTAIEFVAPQAASQ